MVEEIASTTGTEILQLLNPDWEKNTQQTNDCCVSREQGRYGAMELERN